MEDIQCLDNMESVTIERERPEIGQLKFPEVCKELYLKSFLFRGNCLVNCMLCNTTYELPTYKDRYLLHLLETHKLMIADVDKIACLKSYSDYWRIRLTGKPLYIFCSVVKYNTKNTDTIPEYYLLSDMIPEDKILRDDLQRKRLEWILDIQAKERETPISRTCMFCRLHFEGPRSKYLTHLHEKHHLHLGCPDNLVFTDELLDEIENTIERLQCIFCEGFFQERNTLKEHMRKKQHKRINPTNKFYDRFYVVNYLDMGKTWQQVQEECDEIDPVDEKSDWSEWTDDDEPDIVCLFCEERKKYFEEILEHMNDSHSFNFEENCTTLGLNFYQQMKMVNYIRLQMHNLQCSYCIEKFNSKEELLIHISEQQHFKIPDSKLWDQPEFYFPTYENDNFLYHLDDNAVDDENDSKSGIAFVNKEEKRDGEKRDEEKGDEEEGDDKEKRCKEKGDEEDDKEKQGTEKGDEEDDKKKRDTEKDVKK